jgi:hypothetical protein
MDSSGRVPRDEFPEPPVSTDDWTWTTTTYADVQQLASCSALPHDPCPPSSCPRESRLGG